MSEGEQTCRLCHDQVHTLSSDDLCDGCVEATIATNAELRELQADAYMLRRLRYTVAAALMTPHHHREVRDGSPFCSCGFPLKEGDPTECFIFHQLGVKVCRSCRCTDADCSACVAKTGVPCHWVEDDLCSACVT